MVDKICKVCGRTFSPTGMNQKYCQSCKVQGYKNNKKEYNSTHAVEISKKSKQYYIDNISHKKEMNKKWYDNNKELKKEYQKKYRAKNKNIINQKDRARAKTLARKEWLKNKKANDVNFKMSLWCREQIYRCLRSGKDKNTSEILGYTTEQLKQRLESQFKGDMSWENHGTLWHIDHRKPLCMFNFKKDNGEVDYDKIRLANSLANLKPLYISDNLSKSGKMENYKQ